MKKTTLMSAVVATLSLVGCQSTTGSSDAQPEQTSHISQAVYEVEFHAAQSFLSQASQLEQSFADFCSAPKNDVEPVQQQWHSTMLAWMALQGQERGPA
ncbi:MULTISPECIES: imelysin family protein, partial [Vibrio]|nr:iron-regulated protein A [Vibrio alginolyticus]MDW1935096.1 iron-regulated protein A [Vibrio sp. 970]